MTTTTAIIATHMNTVTRKRECRPAPIALPLAAPADDCGHEGHDHGWAPWRYAVLLLPVAIYFVVPLEALSSTGGGAVDVDPAAVASALKGQSKGEDFSYHVSAIESGRRLLR